MATDALACLGNIFVEPKKALTDIRPHAHWAWYPLILSIVIGVAVLVWYYSTVDLNWLAGRMLARIAPNAEPAQLEAMRASFTRSRMIIGSAVSLPVVILAITLLQALYFFLVSRLGGYAEQSYGKWFSFSVWTAFPNVLINVAAAIAYVFAGPRTGFEALDVTSLNTLLFHLPLSHPLAGVIASLHLTTFWVWGLMILGFALWTQKSLGKSALIVLAPWVVIYALWIILKLA